METDTFSPVFAELGTKFVDFVDVLSEVSERTSCATNVDLLRLYEKWIKTGSRRSGQLLVERGVVPNASIKRDTSVSWPDPFPALTTGSARPVVAGSSHASTFLLHRTSPEADNCPSFNSEPFRQCWRLRDHQF